ncbi:hypothetical protein WJX72_007143 [[Myrmecia] bisecta]|uniref:Uncharacterized protein n=1 Tax=[Myrmecia] bisecta TaxID=41462 RepID=A0AAW1PGJ8_9CHLO
MLSTSLTRSAAFTTSLACTHHCTRRCVSASRQLHRPCPAVGRSRQCRATATLSAAASTDSDIEADLRRYLSGLGWGRAWIDGIVEAVPKGILQTNVQKAKAVVEALEAEGVPCQGVCNMASVARPLLGLDVDSQIRPVLDYVKSRGVKGEALVKVLIQHPKLLTYQVASDKKVLVNGKARAAVDVREEFGKAALVSYWREGVQWATAPVSPIKPAVV